MLPLPLDLGLKVGKGAQVLPSGRFVRVQSVGRHLREDDALVLSVAAAAEQRWRASHPRASTSRAHKTRPFFTWLQAPQGAFGICLLYRLNLTIHSPSERV